MKKLESSLKNMALVLTAISVVAGGALAYVNKVTEGPIAEINAKNLQNGIKKVILGNQGGDLQVEEPVEVDGYTLYKTDRGTAVKAVTNGFGGPLEVLVGFDEAGNMPPVDLMDTMTTMGLGQNISFDLYLQNYEQLDALYGKETAETVRGNCGNHFFLQTNSEETANRFAHMLGNRSVLDVQRAGGKLSLSKYYTESTIERPLLMPSELMQLEEGEIAIIRRSKRRDNNGDSIKPRPIFNSRENGHYLWYFHQFAPEEEFPDPNTVNLVDVCHESRKGIDLDARIWDITKSFRMMGIQPDPRLARSSGRKEGNRAATLQETGKYTLISQMLKKTFGEHYEEEYGINGETTVAEYVGFINSQDMTEVEKEVLIGAV